MGELPMKFVCSGGGDQFNNSSNGILNVSTGSGTTFNARHMSFVSSSSSISTIDRKLSLLRHTNPKADKAAIEHENGPHLPICSNWIFSHPRFVAWRDEPNSQLLWIKGGSGTGKTMLLVGVVNKLLLGVANGQKKHGDKKEIEEGAEGRGYIGAYFFCQRNDTNDSKLPHATTVLKGLIYLLVLQKDFLKDHLDSFSIPESSDQDPNSVFILSEILKNILLDLEKSRVYLIVDAINAVEEGLEQLLAHIKYIFETCSNVHWLVSSYDSSLLRKYLGSEGSISNAEQNIQHLELTPETISPAIDSYITSKLTSSLYPWLEHNSPLQAQLQLKISEITPRNFLYTSLLLSELTLENATTALSTIITIPSNLSTMSLRAQTCKLLDHAYSHVESFKNNLRRQDYNLLHAALFVYKSAISVAKRHIPRYDRGLIRAYSGIAECFREMSHARKYKADEKIAYVNEAESYIGKALRMAKQIGDERRARRAMFDRAVVRARRVLVEVKIVNEKEKGKERLRERVELAAKLRKAKRKLRRYREVMVRESQKYGDWADTWLEQLSKELGESGNE
ncbi:hypothetical protein B0O99DRAFT_694381 [Bisporella sp. PMI_857]|nr:hypothetical protein B0O99DRAFT_694381 [Bisporella sp. PMI_857]